MSRTLFKDGAILSMDPEVGDIRRGAVLVEEGRIVHVGPSIEVEDCEVVDASDSIVMPGLVDAHRHLWYAGLRGANMDSVLMDMVADAWGKLGPVFSPGDIYAFTRAAIANALDSGVTTVFDWCHVINTPEHGEAGIQAHREMGMRAVFGYGASMDRKLSELAGKDTPASSWDHATEVRERYFASKDQRLTLALALQGLDYSTLEITRDDIAAARTMGVPMSFHVGGPMGPPPKRSIQRLAAEGLLDADMSFVHCCDASPEEFRLLAEHGGRAITCPGVDAALSIGASASARMRANGLPPCFATDAVVATSGDLFEEARIGLVIDRNDFGLERFAAGESVAEHGDRLSARQALEAVTVAAAEACWLGDQVGSLTPGKRADVILLRASDSNLWPASNLVGTVVSSASRGNVDAVMVDGKFVKRDGALVGVDLAAIRSDLVRARDRLYEAGGYDDIEPKAL
jgi:5-methylthioadenosine/S-adenosylhomocysteine deaminase